MYTRAPAVGGERPVRRWEPPAGGRALPLDAAVGGKTAWASVGGIEPCVQRSCIEQYGMRM